MSIQKRTVFYDNTGGVVRFWDWAIVNTTLGTMAEPFVVNFRSMDAPLREFDPTDEIARIDEMKQEDIGQSLIVLSGGRNQIHGGCMLPRVGR